MPPRQDDPSIAGDVSLYRRIPPYGDRVTWDDQGVPEPSKLNFKDAKDELSLYIAAETTPELALAGHNDFGLVTITAGDIRSICVDDKTKQSVIIICRDDEEPANGHVLVCGKITGGMAKRLRNAAKWVDGRWPRRVDGDSEITLPPSTDPL